LLKTANSTYSNEIIHTTVIYSASIRNFQTGLQTSGSGGQKSPRESRGEALVGDLGDEVPQKLKQFADIVYRFLTAETNKIWKFCTIHLLILDQYVSRWGGLSEMFGG